MRDLTHTRTGRLYHGVPVFAVGYLSKTQVTDAGVKELREALPKCSIHLNR